MLIVAIPKSASSSLLNTLGELHPDLEVLQDFSFRENKIPDQSHKIHSVHSDIREITDFEVSKFKSRDFIYKQHIFPSENNLKALQNIPKVILLRPPEEILKAYKRGALKNHNSLPSGYNARMNSKQIFEKAKKDGFLEDLNFFYNTWISRSETDKTLIVHYSKYLKEPKETINQIEKFFDLPLTKTKVIPARARYSKLSFKDYIKTKKKRLKTLLGPILSYFKLR